MLKAETLLSIVSNIVPGKHIIWPVYDGEDILDAKMIEEYVTSYFRTGNIMPIPNMNLGLNIDSVEIEYDGAHSNHRIVIKGLVVPKKNPLIVIK